MINTVINSTILRGVAVSKRIDKVHSDDVSVEDSDDLILMEASDNLLEHHTVLQLSNWCLDGCNKVKGAFVAASLRVSCATTW